MADKSLEAIFSNLVYKYLSTHVPGLFKYIRAIYILDSDEDEERIVGAVIYKVGDQFYVSPVFYLNSQLRGQDLLYIVANKLMVPANDKWIQFLLSRQPANLGELAFQSAKELGLQSPNIDLISNAAIKAKTASEAELLEGVKTSSVILHKEAAEIVTQYGDYFDFRNVLARHSRAFQQRFLNTIKKNAALAEAIGQFYSLDELANIRPALQMKQAADSSTTMELADLAVSKKDTQNGTIQIIVSVDDVPADQLSDSDRKLLAKGDIVIRDKRYPQQIAKAFKGDMEDMVAMGIRNAPAPGYHLALSVDGKLVPILVLNEDKFTDTQAVTPMTNRSVSRVENAVVRLDTGKLRHYVDASDIFVSVVGDGLKQLPDSVKAITDIDSSAVNKRIIVFDKDWNCVRSMFVHSVVHDDDGIFIKAGDEYAYKEENKSVPCSGFIRVVPGIASPQRLEYDQFYVPETAKFVIVDSGDGDVGLATSAIALKQAAYDAGYYNLKLTTTDGYEWVLTSNGVAGEPLTYKAAMVSLIAKHGLSEADARDMVKEAKDTSVSRRLVKSAIMPLDLNMGGSYDSTIGAVTKYPQETEVPQPSEYNQVPQMDMDEIDPVAQSNVMRAAETGDKNVVDLALLSSMANKRDPLMMVNEFIPDFIVAMDRAGKTLFLLYWHGREFAEHYGKSDIAELESTLKDTFNMLGDLVLFLSRKTVSPLDTTDVPGMGLDKVMSV